MVAAPRGPYARHAREAADEVRRLRDLLRADLPLLEGADGRLPADHKLMALYDAPRAAVRAALTLLRDEGVIDRVPALGTFVTTTRLIESLDGAAVTVSPAHTPSERRLEEEVVEELALALPGPVARRLAVEQGIPGTLRVTLIRLDDEPLAVSTRYLASPPSSEPGRRTAVPVRRVLGTDGRRDSVRTTLIEASKADEYDATLLGVPVGSAILWAEQTEYADGGPVCFALTRVRADRAIFVSRAGVSEHGAP